MSRFKILSRKVHDHPSSKQPKNSRSFVEAGFSAIEFVIEDTETAQRIEVEPIPFTKDDPKFKRNVERLALEKAAEAVRRQRR